MVTLQSSVPVFIQQWHLGIKPQFYACPQAKRKKKVNFFNCTVFKILSFSCPRCDSRCSKQLLTKNGIREVILKP